MNQVAMMGDTYSRITVDAMGDGVTATASMGHDGAVDRLWRQSGLASVNTFYSRVTERLGFTAVRHEGKVTGLAAYVEPPPALIRHMDGRVRFEAPGFSTVSATRVARPDDAFWGELDQYSREEVAAAAGEDAVKAVSDELRVLKDRFVFTRIS